MKKKTLFLLFSLISLFVFTFAVCAKDNNEKKANYPPEFWITDIKEAYKIAKTENKKILINFTGSDWCIWCHRLRDEVFSTKTFINYAKENLVLLYLDFPSEIKLTDKQKFHNQLIAQLLGVRGYPSIWLLDNDFTPLLKTGYRQGREEEYIKHLEEERIDISEEELVKFKFAFKKAIEENLGPFE